MREKRQFGAMVLLFSLLLCFTPALYAKTPEGYADDTDWSGENGRRRGSMDVNSPGFWKTTLTNKDSKRITKPILIDADAKSTDQSRPAFLARPEGSKPYYGFPLIKEISADGFTLGAVTDFLVKDSPAGCTIGDIFVQGPDGSQAGIFWEVDDKLAYYTIESPDESRWGVYSFTVQNPVSSIEDMRKNFLLMLPILKELYKKTH
ncbi:MAG: hypothetical protein PHQ84_06120 [Candidatus Omnitrophica bacterium]|jgi:hypothetical protein|nr:hypothetical protein [Candidatus Omnitrophota bacterium]MDD5078562.1 hypothetical protein [Candidatus Omnitrophota bacterium]